MHNLFSVYFVNLYMFRGHLCLLSWLDWLQSNQDNRMSPNKNISTNCCIHTWADNNVHELTAVKVLHTSLLNTTVVAFKVLQLESYASMPAPSPPFKQFWKRFCGMAFRPAFVLLLMSSVSSKCLPFIISFVFGNRKSHWGLDPVNREGVPTQLFV